jgi:hypothetical protein
MSFRDDGRAPDRACCGAPAGVTSPAASAGTQAGYGGLGDDLGGLNPGFGFHDRFERLRALPATQWGRTTCFRLLLRAGALGIGGSYAPERAYLDGSTGPKAGFEQVWGIRVTTANAGSCEDLLLAWIEHWQQVADEVGVAWPWAPYDPGDLENALCIFQEQRQEPGC